MIEVKKHDGAKPRLDLIPPEVIEALGVVLTSGAKKYSARNWEGGLDWGRCFAACQRHLWAWWGGEDKDCETKQSHLSHALCNIAFLIAYEQRKVGNDDRPKEVQSEV